MVDSTVFDSIKSSVMLTGLSGDDLTSLAEVCELKQMGEGTTVFIENIS